MPDVSNERQDDRRQAENGDDETVSYYDFLPDRLFRRYLRGDEDAGRRALEAVRREVESDLREARR
jgi:methyltransferase-like protein